MKTSIQPMKQEPHKLTSVTSKETPTSQDRSSFGSKPNGRNESNTQYHTLQSGNMDDTPQEEYRDNETNPAILSTHLQSLSLLQNQEQTHCPFCFKNGDQVKEIIQNSHDLSNKNQQLEFQREFDESLIRQLNDKLNELQVAQSCLKEGEHGLDSVLHRCVKAEESLRQETEHNELMRVEIQMLKDGIERGLKSFGISFHHQKTHPKSNIKSIQDGYLQII